MEERISVAEVLELGVSITWQQAVAVTLEAWHASENAHVRKQPAHLDAESCMLTLKGDVILPRLATAHQPGGALQLLRAMLDGIDAPPELVEVAFGKGAETLGDDLALFSRPNRRIEITDVAQRGLVARAALALSTATTQPAAVAAPAPRPETSLETDAFSALREEAAARAPAAPAKPSVGNRRPATRGWALALTGAAAIVGAVLVWRAWPVASPSPVVEALVDELPAERSAPDRAWSAAGQRSADVHLARRPARSASGALVMADAGADAPAGFASDAAASPAPTDASAAPAGETSPESASPATPELASTTVYTWRSVGVEPPTMEFPRMPRAAFPEPDADIDDLPYLEVLVNEHGSVDAVRLRGNVASSDVVRHGMMMAPAKAWQFSPATRNGEPVKYVVRVLVNQ